MSYFFLRFPRGIAEHFPVASKLQIHVLPRNQMRRVERMILCRGYGATFVAKNESGRVYTNANPSNRELSVFGRRRTPQIHVGFFDALEKIGAMPAEEVELLKRFEDERNALMRERESLSYALKSLQSWHLEASPEQVARLATLEQAFNSFQVEVGNE